MYRAAIGMIFVGLLFGATCCTAQAQAPPYLVLRAPAAPTHHAPSYNRYPGQAIGVTTQAYSYGWFGAQPRQHWSRHFGYYRNYTQWSGK